MGVPLWWPFQNSPQHLQLPPSFQAPGGQLGWEGTGARGPQAASVREEGAVGA